MSVGDYMKFIKFLFKFAMSFLVIFALFLVVLYIYSTITPPIDIKYANNVSIYDKDGTLISSGNSNKEWIKLKDISPYLINASIATEDKRFFRHFGFDFIRIAKSLYINIINRNLKEGASTITQQYARNLFLDFNKTWKRKLDEALLAFELEVHYSKDEILEGYLNTINYGNNILGIENASLYYFNKSSSDLSLAEASMLAGIPKSPNNYSPLNDELEVKERQSVILYNMLKNNLITEKEKEDALNTELIYYGKKDRLNLSTLMYYQNAVINELKSFDFISAEFIEKNGIKIYTSLDLNAQSILEDNINLNMKEDLELQISSIMMKPYNGEIIALVGGRDYSKSEYNRATMSKRQVGSTMKPFLYYAALENGFTPSTTFLSEPTTFTFSENSSYSPKNYGEIYPKKEIPMTIALAYSNNIYAIKTGTTNTDSWIVGYNSEVILGIWNGYDNNKNITNDISKISKNIWVNSIEKYLREKESSWYEMPNNVIGIIVDPFTGKISTNSNKKKILYYIKGTEPVEIN